MKCALMFFTACAPATLDPQAWQLDQDRVIAVRVTPPGLAAGEHAMLDGLLAHADGPTTIETPSAVSAPTSPLYAAVNFLIDHYEVIAPDEPTLAATRMELGLAAGTPIPLPLDVYFGPLRGDHFTTHKAMTLGASLANPVLPAITLDGAPVAGLLALVPRHDIALVAAANTVRWLTSCGTLRDADEPDAILRIDEPCDGELVVVVRDAVGGTVWQVWQISAQ